MKKFLLIIAIVAMVLPSCKKINDELDALGARLDKLEQKTIPTIDEQITAIQTSIEALEEIDKSLDESIKALEDSDKATAKEIAALKDADKAIEAKIAELKKYVDEAINSTKNWVNATFATLEQLNALSGEVVALKSLVNANKTEAASNLANAISALETSLKAWVGEQLSNYYTIAEVEAKILALQNAIASGDTSLQEELNNLKSQLEASKKDLTEAYKKAIEEAINTNNGVIDTKIANEVAAVNNRINIEIATINAKISDIEARLDNVEAQIKDLLTRIQSVSYIPTYSDGKATVKYAGNISRVILDFEISPKDAVAELANVWQETLSVKAVYTKTRAVSFVDMQIVGFETDTTNGVISVTVSGENLSAEFFSGTQEASARLSISDGNSSVTSDYIPMVAAEKIDNEIWYTSTNDNVVVPNATDAFGANIVSNTCEYKLGIITFDAPVTSIGDNAFAGRTSLTSVTIPDSVTSIGNWAFNGCKSLTNITIPDSVTSIGVCGFKGCSSMISITIPDSVTSIGSSAFAGCSSLKSFYGKFASEDNRYLIIDGVLNSFAIGCGTTEYTIPDSVTSIGGSAFSGCTSLTSITIPDSVTEIGREAFSGCTSLTSVDITDLSVWCKISFSDSYANPLCNGAKLYLNGSELTDITIPSDITEIQSYAFYSCTSLTSVTIPDSVRWVEWKAFSGCTSLTSATIGNRVISIGNYAFSGCSSLTSITIPNSVTEIGNYAFYGCSSLTSITIPDSVTEIGWEAFSGCSALTSINIPKKVGYIGGQAFAGCTGTLLLDNNIIETDYSASPFDNSQSWLYGSQFTELIVGSSITTIGDFAFASCGSLTSVTISDGVTAIGEKAFHYCTKLTSITIPESVVSIGTDAMDACSNLTSLYGPLASEDNRCIIIDGELVVFAEAGLTSYSIPDSATTIGFYVFDHCTNLTSITIPKSVTLIKESAFSGCSALIEVNCMPTTAPNLCNPYTFNNNASGRKIYVPVGSGTAYKTASYWSEYAADIVEKEF
ncbi:MAG: leucine-rich repeat protein [Alistipes sp.]|nr:leucine-rich repeat protein [Alistipes sp.]